MRAKTDAVTNQTAAHTNKTTTGTRHDASISAGATGGIAGTVGETDGDEEGIALIEKKAANLYSIFGLCAPGAPFIFWSRAPWSGLRFPAWEGLGVGSWSFNMA